MLDIKFIRDNTNFVQDRLKAKGVEADLKEILDLDKKRRETIADIDELRAKQNDANDQISKLLKDKKDAKAKIAEMKAISEEISKLEPGLKETEAKLTDVMLSIPNLPNESVPVGGVDKNKKVRSWGTIPKFKFKPKNHIELAEKLDIIDFKRAAKISGSNFVLYKGAGAKLERALYNFMLNTHTKEHGYTEVFPPVLVNTDAMTGTGQLPKMKEDMYCLKDDGLYLIPTAEVPITNIHRDEILREEDLPVSYTGYSACFRREAGSYGKDTRGLVRVHQFNKVELVRLVTPKASYDELEKLVTHAEKILQLLKLPYRVVMLASRDLSFAAAKCYDLESYAAGTDKWLEVSSCSNFEDFQARRCGIRYKGKQTKKPVFVHTLNGSGLALPRTMISILENYQTADGDVIIPEVLKHYMGGMERIRKN